MVGLFWRKNKSSDKNITANSSIDTIDIIEDKYEYPYENTTNKHTHLKNTDTTIANKYPSPEVQFYSPSTKRGASSNYLSLKSRATPGDRGGGDGGEDVTSSGSGLPVADLREAEGQLNKEGTTPSGKTSSGEADVRIVTSGGGGNILNGLFTGVQQYSRLGIDYDGMNDNYTLLDDGDDELLLKSLVDMYEYSEDNRSARSTVYRHVFGMFDSDNITTGRKQSKLILYIMIIILISNPIIGIYNMYNFTNWKPWSNPNNISNFNFSLVDSTPVVTTSHSLVTPSEVQSNSSSTRRRGSPLEVSPAVSSSNLLSLKSKATPGDRGSGDGSDWTSSGMKTSTGPQVEPVADLREAEGQLNIRAPCNGKKGPQVEADGMMKRGGLELGWKRSKEDKESSSSIATSRWINIMDLLNWVSSILPVADLREAKGQLNREGHHGEWEVKDRTSSGEADVRNLTSGGRQDILEGLDIDGIRLYELELYSRIISSDVYRYAFYEIFGELIFVMASIIIITIFRLRCGNYKVQLIFPCLALIYIVIYKLLAFYILINSIKYILIIILINNNLIYNMIPNFIINIININDININNKLHYNILKLLYNLDNYTLNWLIIYCIENIYITISDIIELFFILYNFIIRFYKKIINKHDLSYYTLNSINDINYNTNFCNSCPYILLDTLPTSNTENYIYNMYNNHGNIGTYLNNVNIYDYQKHLNKFSPYYLNKN